MKLEQNMKIFLLWLLKINNNNNQSILCPLAPSPPRCGWLQGQERMSVRRWTEGTREERESLWTPWKHRMCSLVTESLVCPVARDREDKGHLVQQNGQCDRIRQPASEASSWVCRLRDCRQASQPLWGLTPSSVKWRNEGLGKRILWEVIENCKVL